MSSSQKLLAVLSFRLPSIYRIESRTCDRTTKAEQNKHDAGASYTKDPLRLHWHLLLMHPGELLKKFAAAYRQFQDLDENEATEEVWLQ